MGAVSLRVKAGYWGAVASSLFAERGLSTSLKDLMLVSLSKGLLDMVCCDIRLILMRNLISWLTNPLALRKWEPAV